MMIIDDEMAQDIMAVVVGGVEGSSLTRGSVKVASTSHSNSMKLVFL